MGIFGATLFQITGQQLSVAATRRTIARIDALFGGHLPSPSELLAVDANELRGAGLSWRKIGTLHDLAERLVDGRLDEHALAALPDDDFIAALTAIPGIGPWTAQGVLLVALQREDVIGCYGDHCFAEGHPGSVSRLEPRSSLTNRSSHKSPEVAAVSQSGHELPLLEYLRRREKRRKAAPRMI